jgi:hypothetical protein
VTVALEYKPAAQMVVADALSRTSKFPTTLDESPDEDDPFFPYVDQPPSSITLPNGQNLVSLSTNEPCNNFLNVHKEYDADTEDNIDYPIHPMKTSFSRGKDHSYSTSRSLSRFNQKPSRHLVNDSEITSEEISGDKDKKFQDG